MGCGTGLMKTILIVFNVIFLIVGKAAIGLGAWLVISSEDLFNFLEFDPEVGTQLLKAAAYVFIACGCIVVLLSIFGICGACMRNNCMLGTYSAIVITILIAEIAAIAMFVDTDKFEDDFKGTLTTYLQEHFNNKTDENKAFKEATEKLQVEGCFDAFKDEFNKHKRVIIGVASGILAFEFILIVFTICLCRSK